MKFRGKYAFLSNFYDCTINYLEITFSSVEVAYQAMKLEDLEDRLKFSKLSARESKKEIKNYKIRKDWNHTKVSVMQNLLHLKFADPILKQKLLDTGEQELVENNDWGDTFWGVYEGYGENILGKLLMKTQEYYRNVEE